MSISLRVAAARGASILQLLRLKCEAEFSASFTADGNAGYYTSIAGGDCRRSEPITAAARRRLPPREAAGVYFDAELRIRHADNSASRFSSAEEDGAAARQIRWVKIFPPHWRHCSRH